MGPKRYQKKWSRDQKNNLAYFLQTDCPMSSILLRGKNNVYNATLTKVNHRYKLRNTICATCLYVQFRFTRYLTLLRIPNAIMTFAYKN